MDGVLNVVGGLLLGQVIARSQGVQDSAEANRLGLLVGALGATPASLLVATTVAQQEAAPTQGPPSRGSVQVPDVTGIGFKVASDRLTGIGLTAVRREVVSDNAQADQVIAQAPQAGTFVVGGSTIVLTVSVGLPIPNVVGKSLADATDQLTALGLQVQTQQEFDSSANTGIVIRQEPAAGAQVSAGDQATLTVSRGTGVLVPDVTGKGRDEAEKAITGTGLAVGTETQDFSDTVEQGNVISQDPSPGTRVDPRTPVNLTVSKGKGTQVPDVTGQSRDEATTTLKAASLTVDPASTTIESPNVTADVVADQSPEGGETAPAGSAVTLTLLIPTQVQAPRGRAKAVD